MFMCNLCDDMFMSVVYLQRVAKDTATLQNQNMTSFKVCKYDIIFKQILQKL